MSLPQQRIRLIAATPIDVGERRLLPSVLVTATEGGEAATGLFSQVKARPVSVVVSSPDGTQWLEIPNTTADIIHTMMAAGLGIAGAGVLILLLVKWVRNL